MEANTPNIQGRLLQSISQPKQWTASTGNKLRPVHGYENPTNQFNSGQKHWPQMHVKVASVINSYDQNVMKKMKS